MSEPTLSSAPSPAPRRSNIGVVTLLFVGMNVAILFAVFRSSPAQPPSVSGRVTLIGKPPPEIPIAMPANCATNHPRGKPMTRFYVVGQDDGLGDVFVYVKSGLTNLPYPAPTNAVVMRQAGCMYLDYVIGAQTGQPIHVRNTDPILHNIHITPRAPGNRKLNYAHLPRQTVAAGRPFAASAPTTSRMRQQWERLKAGIRGLFGVAPPPVRTVSEYTFHLHQPDLAVRLKCDVHPWEMGYVNCVDHPFFAMTDSNGQFRFPQPPPPGRYVLEAFHRKAGSQSREIEVKAGEPVKVEFELTVPK